MVRFLLLLCVFVCGLRLWTRGYDGPAFHTASNDVVFILLHLWLVLAFPRMELLLMSTYFIEGLERATRISESVRQTKQISKVHGRCGLVLIVFLSLWILVAWGYHFTSEYYMASGAESPRFWFGLISTISFALIVWPWVASLVSFGATLQMLTMILLLQFHEVFGSLNAMLSEYFSDDWIYESENWIANKNELIRRHETGHSADDYSDATFKVKDAPPMTEDGEPVKAWSVRSWRKYGVGRTLRAHRHRPHGPPPGQSVRRNIDDPQGSARVDNADYDDGRRRKRASSQ